MLGGRSAVGVRFLDESVASPLLFLSSPYTGRRAKVARRQRIFFMDLSKPTDGFRQETGLRKIGRASVSRKMKWAAYFLLGLLFCPSWGEGLNSAPKFSEELRNKAADGDADAQFQLGDCYFFGLGVPKDMREGASWYRKAAEAGQMKAQFNLGGCFHEGMGVEPDLMAAIQWWRKSAGQDYAPAEISIGDCYIFGKGLAQDEEEGVRWFRKAAAQNYPAAQHRLGNCYYHGQGVRKDLVQSIQWYRKAAAQGYRPSQRALRDLGDNGSD